MKKKRILPYISGYLLYIMHYLFLLIAIQAIILGNPFAFVGWLIAAILMIQRIEERTIVNLSSDITTELMRKIVPEEMRPKNEDKPQNP